MSQNYCQACEDDMENQQAHFGGCIPDPYYYEDDIFNSQVEAANTLLAIKNEKCVHQSFEKALREGHFVAAQIPFSLYSSGWNSFNFGWPVAERIIKELRDDWGVNVNSGDWVFTTYQVPFDIAEAGAKEFSWDYIYKVPEKYTYLLKKTTGNDIRYGLPKGEEFIKPIKRQYYGHPALFDLKTNAPFKDLTPMRKKMKKKLYELNQLRMLNIEQSGYGFKDYKLEINRRTFDEY